MSDTTSLSNTDELNRQLLEEFAEHCHVSYTGCYKNGELWDYCYSDEIVNMIDDFLGKRAEIAGLSPTNSGKGGRDE